MLMVLMALAAASSESGKIEKFLRDPVPLYNADGSEAERRRTKDIPPPVTFNGVNEFGDLKIRVNGKDYYVRRADVKFSGGKVVCAPSASPARAAGRRQGVSDPGVRAGAGSGSRECVQP